MQMAWKVLQMNAKFMLDITLNSDGRLFLPELLEGRVSKGTTISDGPALNYNMEAVWLYFKWLWKNLGAGWTHGDPPVLGLYPT